MIEGFRGLGFRKGSIAVSRRGFETQVEGHS